MSTISLNTNLLPLFDASLYGNGLLTPDYQIDEYMEEENVDYDDIDFDYDGYKQDIVSLANDNVKPMYNDIFSEVGVQSWKFDGYFSPKYYNYSSDKVGIEMELADDFYERAKSLRSELEGSDKVQDYISTHYRSYDGYWCFMPSSIEEMYEYMEKEPYHNDHDRGVSAFLTLMIVLRSNKSIEKMCNDATYDIASDLYVWEHISVKEGAEKE